jgi:hypothetical protein
MSISQPPKILAEKQTKAGKKVLVILPGVGKKWIWENKLPNPSPPADPMEEFLSR